MFGVRAAEKGGLGTWDCGNASVQSWAEQEAARLLVGSEARGWFSTLLFVGDGRPGAIVSYVTGTRHTLTVPQVSPLSIFIGKAGQGQEANVEGLPITRRSCRSVSGDRVPKRDFGEQEPGSLSPVGLAPSTAAGSLPWLSGSTWRHVIALSTILTRASSLT